LKQDGRIKKSTLCTEALSEKIRSSRREAYLALCYDTNTFPPPAPLKTQCSKDYFYGKDTRFEKILTNLEGRAESLFSTVCQTDSIPKDALTKRDILAVLGVMQGRTRISIEQRDSLFDQAMKATMRKDPEFEAITSIPKADIDSLNFATGFHRKGPW